MVMMIQILKKKRIKELSEELNEVKQINSDLVKKNEWEYLISSINMFITKTLSTSVRSCEQSIPGKQPIISPIRLNKLLAAYGITLLKPLSPGEWKSFCEEVVCDQNGNLSERIGVHPVVLEVIKATLKRASFESAQNSAAIKSASSSSSSSTLPIAAEPMIPVHYDIQHEVIKVDEEKIAKIPDVTIVTRHCRSKSIGSSVLIIEIKKKSGLIEAINQSLGYLMVKLRDRLEIAEEARSRIFGFCFGTNGYNIILGCIEIQNFKLSVQCTNLDEIPFWISPDK